MLSRHRVPTHPGEILLREYLEPLGITQVAFAKNLGVPVQRINELVRGKRGVTAETAGLLADALDVSPEFWMNLQSGHHLARVSANEYSLAAERKAPAVRPLPALVGAARGPSGQPGAAAGRPDRKPLPPCATLSAWLPKTRWPTGRCPRTP